jgi:hypothetical protein
MNLLHRGGGMTPCFESEKLITSQNASTVLWENPLPVLWTNPSTVLWTNPSTVLWMNPSTVIWKDFSKPWPVAVTCTLSQNPVLRSSDYFDNSFSPWKHMFFGNFF